MNDIVAALDEYLFFAQRGNVCGLIEFAPGSVIAGIESIFGFVHNMVEGLFIRIGEFCAVFSCVFSGFEVLILLRLFLILVFMVLGLIPPCRGAPATAQINDRKLAPQRLGLLVILIPKCQIPLIWNGRLNVANSLC